MKTPRNPLAGTDVQSITLHEDGFAWEALVRIAGVAYVASYIGARLQVRLAAAERPSRRRAWHIDAVRVWSLSKILDLSPDWHAHHEALHGVREQREAVRRAALDRLVALEGEAA